MSVDHYTYRVTWSSEDDEHVGLCIEFPSLSWLSKTPGDALTGIQKMVAETIADLKNIIAENSECEFHLNCIVLLLWKQLSRELV
jgi:hypothetical protein